VNVVGQYGHEYSRRVRSLRRPTAAARVAFEVTRRRISPCAVASVSEGDDGPGADAVARRSGAVVAANGANVCATALSEWLRPVTV
jgi:hypothetical protein